MKRQEFRYRRSDFRPLPVALEHLDIHLNFAEGYVEASGRLRMTPRTELRDITLDARELDLLSVTLELDGRNITPEYTVEREEARLTVRLPRVVAAGEVLALSTTSRCTPTNHVLEGIYKDTTPPDCPQQYMSQCQQWGFQRIIPILDDCTAKCTMRTTIEADARYTHMISNGNVDRGTNPSGKPVPMPGNPSRQTITYVNPQPMAPYLFLVCVGTWDEVTDEVVYPSGRHVRLEYLVPPGCTGDAVLPMRILKTAVLWQHRTQEYEYPYDVYRTICMEKSNFGGMENVGNTTIVTSAALIDEFTTDRRLEYAYAIIVHEFEHNQCGSDVTMETPFDMWLNEGFTVDVERQFSMAEFDSTCVRLDAVDAMRAPISGPLSIEDGGHMGNIVREGFNDPDELVDGVTYVKAAEVIRMLRLLLGEFAFREAKNLYFSRHSGGNANTDQFFACFEEKGGRDLTQFKREWLHTVGYPRIEISHRYDPTAERLSLDVRQSRSGRGGMFHVPLAVAAVDAEGHDIPGIASVLEITQERTVFDFAPVPPPAFLSLNRDCSFYGEFHEPAGTHDAWARQVRLDPSAYNRVEAMRRLTEAERIALIHNPSAQPSEPWLALHAALLHDPSLSPGLRAYLLSVDEESLDRRYLPLYRERYEVRRRILKAVAERLLPDLRDAFQAVNTYARPAEPKDGLEERRLKAVLLRALTEANTSETQQIAEEHFRKAWNITDKMSALSCINISDHPRRRELLHEAFDAWHGHLNGYTNYLALIGRGVHEDVFDMLAEEQRRPQFRIDHPSHSRALFLPMASNNKMLWTPRGLDWMVDTVLQLAAVNDYTAARLLGAFQLVAKLGADLRPRVTETLDRILCGLDASSCPSTTGRIQAYLDGMK